MKRRLDVALWLCLATSAAAAAPEGAAARDGAAAKEAKPVLLTDYLVLADPGEADEFLPAAQALATFHGADLQRFDPGRLDAVLALLRKAPPRYVVFVLPPAKIDVDLARAVLSMAAQVDDDPFVDFEYGFITGRDGAAAGRFVERIKTAWGRDWEKTGALFGTWEGALPPLGQPLSATRALGFEFQQFYVRTNAKPEDRTRVAGQALQESGGKAVLLFFSHGYPDEMSACFRAPDLRGWRVDLEPAILFNCACYNGCPGRWYLPHAGGYQLKPAPAIDDSVALALLDSGISAYFAGVDAWHGPLTNQVFLLVTDDGLRLGEAAKRMFDRLALDFLPERIRFEPAREMKWTGEGSANRRRNGAAMILYGDPAFAPFGKQASRLLRADLERDEDGSTRVRLDLKPLVVEAPGADFMLATARLMDYYSVRSEDIAVELKMELHTVLPLPAAARGTPRLALKSARCGDQTVPAGEPQLTVEETPRGRFLHVRLPITAPMLGGPWLTSLAVRGMTAELAGKS